MRRTILLAVGVAFFALGMEVGVTNSKASTFLNPAYYHPKVLGYTVPKALRGSWYFGTKKFHSNTHHFLGNHYYKGKTTRYMISRHLVKMDWEINGHDYRAKSYFDGGLLPGAKKGELGWDFGEEYTPVIFSYKGHNHKGVDLTGHNPDVLYTRKPTHNYLSFDGYYATKVKLVKIGW